MDNNSTGKAGAGKVDFPIPQGFIVPESAATNNGEFDVVCTLKQEGDKLCVVKVGDKPMPGYGGEEQHDETKEAAKKPGYDNMVDGLMAERPAPAAPSYG